MKEQRKPVCKFIKNVVINWTKFQILKIKFAINMTEFQVKWH